MFGTFSGSKLRIQARRAVSTVAPSSEKLSGEPPRQKLTAFNVQLLRAYAIGPCKSKALREAAPAVKIALVSAHRSGRENRKEPAKLKGRAKMRSIGEFLITQSK